MNDRLYWVWLSMVFFNSTHRCWQILEIFETAEAAYNELVFSGKSLSLTANEQKNVKAYTLKDAENLIEECRKKNIMIAVYTDEDYPANLRKISSPPLVLYYKGNIRCLSGRRAVTSVGTRKAGEYGISACRRVCSELAKKGVVIVSGFAVGIDITSHMAAADKGCPTVCVLGCGVDYDYPKENFIYRDKIIASGGAFVSEYPPGTRPNRGNFPKRNRILSALGDAAVVFEAPKGSGSLITADLALEQGKDIFVLPPADIFSGAFGGNIQLLREGAGLLLGAEDIIAALDGIDKADEGDSSYPADKSAPVMTETAVQAAVIKASELENASSGLEKPAAPAEKQEAPRKVRNYRFDDIPRGIQREIAMLLNYEGSLHADIISEKLGVDSAEVLIELTELEMLGIVKQLPGRIYDTNIQ